MEDRLKRRKLDALRRGVHRVTGGESLPLTTHVVGIGKAGAAVIAQIVRDLEPGAAKLTALAIDIGGQDLSELRELANETPGDRAEITTVALEVPDAHELFDALGHYDEFLKLEYPGYRWAESSEPWLPRSVQLPPEGQHVSRAVAKAIYGFAYYSGERRMQRALRSFASAIEAESAQAVVAVVFGMGGGTGSGIAVDLARHLSNRFFGRRALVAGIGIAPCDGDLQVHRGASLFPVLSELDVLGDESKNRGVVMSCGDMFRNPFTAGFIMVPQQHVWRATGDLSKTNHRVDMEIASLIADRKGANIWELLRLLNWVAAPSTQHSAARTPWGQRWIHLLAFAETIEPNLRDRLGVLTSYKPEFIEMRVQEVNAQAAQLADGVQRAFEPEVPPQVVGGGRAGSAQFILPRLAKTDLALFYQASAAYNAEDERQRLLDHALLLDQRIMLCEPSTEMAGMAGASLSGGRSWVAVPLTDIQVHPSVDEQVAKSRASEFATASI